MRAWEFFSFENFCVYALGPCLAPRLGVGALKNFQQELAINSYTVSMLV